MITLRELLKYPIHMYMVASFFKMEGRCLQHHFMLIFQEFNLMFAVSLEINCILINNCGFKQVFLPRFIQLNIAHFL